ncbi:MAG TPA: bifunctional DNA-formamidopyrimidine glycosylase/DNA-(apurinic or apyrimidinic site) lyase [Candidatus Bathyarchaeia archaeon]|nr:bifunctional DNA-formamidopyrimidine glycosylase/DNA-(apurinic or apyrimidinic site) lyase [Candidatus Bathyarchaeia archaeon]
MPELPEVETIARGLDKRIAGDMIESVWLGSKPEPLKSPAAEIAAVLERSRIVRVRRVGKHIVFDLEGPGIQVSKTARRRAPVPSNTSGARALAGSETGAHMQWIVHLGMTGQLLIASPESELLKHTHAVLKLASGRELRFVDPRRFGRLAVVRLDPQNGSGFAAPGDEPLDSGIDRFIALFRNRKTPIKSALLNQKLLSGVGNIYADEALFRAGVRPRRRASSLTRDELKKLHRGLKEVLRQAIKLGGSSVNDYVDAEGRAGFFQLKHRVYGRETKPCLVCRTPIKRVIIAGRSSHYCPHCQK